MHFPIHPVSIVVPVYLSGGNYFLGQVCSSSRGITETVYVPPVPAQTLSVVGIWLHGLQLFSKNTGFWRRHAECAGTWGVNQVSDVYSGTNCYCDTNISNRSVFTKHPPGLTRITLNSQSRLTLWRGSCVLGSALTLATPGAFRRLTGRIPEIQH